jgi:hypothetical protein
VGYVVVAAGVAVAFWIHPIVGVASMFVAYDLLKYPG